MATTTISDKINETPESSTPQAQAVRRLNKLRASAPTGTPLATMTSEEIRRMIRSCD